MKKRLLLLLCLTLMAGSAAWAGIIAQNTFSSGGSWKITDDGELYVDAVTIPDYKDIYEVNSNHSVQHTGTTAPWSSYKDRIRTIRFSSRVHTIGKWAFAVLTKVSTTTFESKGSVHIIKGHAF